MNIVAIHLQTSCFKNEKIFAGIFGEKLKAGCFIKNIKVNSSNYHFTDHSYDYLGMAPRSFNSFTDFEQDVSNARVFAGIHYRVSCERAVKQGEIIGQNINNKLKFKK